MYDLKIVGGILVDGSGEERYAGDLGIKDGKIVDVGKCEGSAAQTIDASGAIVAPGMSWMLPDYAKTISAIILLIVLLTAILRSQFGKKCSHCAATPSEKG